MRLLKTHETLDVYNYLILLLKLNMSHGMHSFNLLPSKKLAIHREKSQFQTCSDPKHPRFLALNCKTLSLLSSVCQDLNVFSNVRFGKRVDLQTESPMIDYLTSTGVGRCHVLASAVNCGIPKWLHCKLPECSMRTQGKGRAGASWYQHLWWSRAYSEQWGHLEGGEQPKMLVPG